MCLFPRLIENKKYKPNKKNNYKPPKMKDERVKFVPVGCGKCIECLKQKQREWRVRLDEEIQNDKTGKFVTLTLSDESFEELNKCIEDFAKGYVRDNLIATLAVRRFLERWRKKYKKSVKHWLITEWGQSNTERMHLHGIIFTDKPEDIQPIWKYGHVYIGEFVNEKSINYIVKYLGKFDEKHPNYVGKILTSKGIGKGYLKKYDSKKNKFKGKETKEFYKTQSGVKLALPIYYRNKIYSEEEREKLWLQKLDEQKIFVMGEEIDISTPEGEKNYMDALKYYQSVNNRLGYGNGKIDWDKKNYNIAKNKLKHLQENLKRKG